MVLSIFFNCAKARAVLFFNFILFRFTCVSAAQRLNYISLDESELLVPTFLKPKNEKKHYRSDNAARKGHFIPYAVSSV